MRSKHWHKRGAAWLALLALCLQALMPALHHPASMAMAGMDMSMPGMDMSAMDMPTMDGPPPGDAASDRSDHGADMASMDMASMDMSAKDMPDMAMSAGDMSAMDMSGMDMPAKTEAASKPSPGNEPPAHPAKGPVRTMPPCALCFAVHAIGGFAPPASIAAIIARAPSGTGFAFAQTAAGAQRRAFAKQQPRAPPALA